MNRRDSLKFIAGASVVLADGVKFGSAAVAQGVTASGEPFKLPPLGYAESALEPYIDATTMMIHHDRHHAAYVAQCNQLAKQWPQLASMPMETVLADLGMVPESVRTGVRNNLGGHWNHSFFWELMTPGGAKEPAGELATAINSAFGGATGLSEKVNAAGLARFGSGWAWLVVGKDKALDIVSTANQDTPLEKGVHPVLGVDVWEHAYYLKYQNRRADYLKAWWNTVNWDKALANYKKAAA